MCDGTGDCQTCVNCGSEGACLPEAEACGFDPECIAFNDCANACPVGDDICINDCFNQYPNGANTYLNWLTCVVCVTCYSDCDGAGFGCF